MASNYNGQPRPAVVFVRDGASARGHPPRDLRGPLPARPVGHRLLVGFIAAGWRNRNKELFTPWQRNQLAKVKAIAGSGTHPHAHFRSSLEALGLAVDARPCAARSGSRPSPMNAIYLRSSVRQYTDEPVDIRDIEKLMRAAMAAPSAVNQQPWEFYIARDETTRLALAASSPYGTPAKLAPCVIVACQRTEGLRAPQDASYDMSASRGEHPHRGRQPGPRRRVARHRARRRIAWPPLMWPWEARAALRPSRSSPWAIPSTNRSPKAPRATTRRACIGFRMHRHLSR